MKKGLRERFQPNTLKEPEEDLLVRLGALYHLTRQVDQTEIERRLLELIEPLGSGHLDSDDLDSTLFSLHAAVLLAQHNSFEGVRWILRCFSAARTHELRTLIETALRNCTQFPLAVLLAQVTELSEPGVITENIESLTRCSEDDLFAFSQKPEEEQQQHLASLVAWIDAVRQLPHRTGRELTLGTVISRPAQKDFGYRYTGFIGLDRGDVSPLIVPYDLADVLNRDDRHAQQSVWRLLGQSGRRAILVYNTDSNHEAQALYVFPFAPLSRDEMEFLIVRLAAEAEGLDIAVVVECWSDERGDRYRLLTSSGRTLVQTYRADEQRIGNCFLVHDLNTKTLWTRYRLHESGVADVVQRFVQNTDLDRAVHVISWENGHRLVTQRGNVITKYGELPADFIYMVEETERGEFVFQLPFGLWQPADRSQVLQAFFDGQPGAFGVVLETFQWHDGSLRARAVRAKDGEQRLKPVEQPAHPGTVVYWETNDKGESFANLLLDQRIVGGCQYCFGARYRICEECEGKGKVTCPDCEGTRRVTCVNCYGSGREDCGHCNGTGERVFICNNCNGSGTWQGTCNNCGGSGTYTGTCKVCGGSGRYADTGRTCVKCGGIGSFSVQCRKCSGTGTVSSTCKRCDGQGQWTEKCKTCHGSGRWDCGICHGRGHVHCTCDDGSVTCDNCGGNRISLCGCRGEKRGTIVPV